MKRALATIAAYMVAAGLGFNTGYWYGRTRELYESAKYYKAISNDTSWEDFLSKKPAKTHTSPSPLLTSQWHKEEETKINQAVEQLRVAGKWNEQWDKFSMLGDYGWRKGMDCGDGTHPMPCMSGGYTFSESAFEKVKRGDLSHDARNSAEKSFQSFEAARPR